MVFVDTSAWFAAVVPSDPNHSRAASWLATNSDVLITTDYVVDETLTLLRARGERQRAKLLGEKFFDGSIAEVYFLTEEDIRQAWVVFE
jgi:predicted nucleic acid-binding protein